MNKNIEVMVNELTNNSGNESLLGMAEKCLILSGRRPQGNSLSILNDALVSSDYPNVLSGTLNRQIAKLHPNSPAAFRSISDVGTVPNFKSGVVARLTGAGLYAEVGPGGEIPAMPPIEEGGESFQLKTYGGHVALSREIFMDDDLQGLSDHAAWQTRTALRTVNRLVFTKLLENPTLSDGTALFHADRSNLLTGAGSALDSTSLGEAMAALRSMGDENGSYGLQPAVLAVPPALEVTGATLIKNIAMAGQDRLQLVTEPLLADTSLGGSSGNWYLLPAPAVAPIIRVQTLAGQGLLPVVTEFLGFVDNTVNLKATLDVSVVPVSHRGIRSAGA